MRQQDPAQDINSVTYINPDNPDRVGRGGTGQQIHWRALRGGEPPALRNIIFLVLRDVLSPGKSLVVEKGRSMSTHP